MADAVRTVLQPLCAREVTGVLHILDPPGGAVHLTRGLVTQVECPLVGGVGELLVNSGRLSAEEWSSAMAAGGAELLLERNQLSRTELELVTLSTLFGAALFLLDAAPATRFEPRPRHPLGPVRMLELESLCTEIDRRRRMLTDTWPDASLDTALIGPVSKLDGHHVALTALQWEIVANADRSASPLDLARRLGRDTFAFLLEARRLVRAGLVEVLARTPPAIGAAPLPRRRVRALPARHDSEPAVPIGTLLRIRRALEEVL